MGKVLQFPTQDDHDWLELKRELQEILLAKGANPEQTHLIIERMKTDFYSPVDGLIELTPPFPPTLPEAEADAIMDYMITRIEQASQEIFRRFRRNLLIRQTELYLDFVRRLS